MCIRDRYYLNTRYNVLRTDIQGDIMTAAEVETYITGTLWKQTTYSTLRERDGQMCIRDSCDTDRTAWRNAT